MGMVLLQEASLPKMCLDLGIPCFLLCGLVSNLACLNLLGMKLQFLWLSDNLFA